MKKVILLASVAVLLFSGCDNKTGEVEGTPIEDTIQIITVPQEPAIFSGFPATQEELFAMSLEDFKAAVESNIPNYRKYFIIDEDRVLTDEDWETIRTLVSLELFGSTRPDVSEETEDAASDETETDPNEIYYNPDSEYIRSLTDEEFVEYLAGLQAYLNPEGEVADFSQLTSEQIEQVRNEMLAGLEE